LKVIVRWTEKTDHHSPLSEPTLPHLPDFLYRLAVISSSDALNGSAQRAVTGRRYAGRTRRHASKALVPSALHGISIDSPVSLNAPQSAVLPDQCSINVVRRSSPYARRVGVARAYERLELVSAAQAACRRLDRSRRCRLRDDRSRLDHLGRGRTTTRLRADGRIRPAQTRLATGRRRTCPCFVV